MTWPKTNNQPKNDNKNKKPSYFTSRFHKLQLWQFKLSYISEGNMHIIIQDEGLT